MKSFLRIALLLAFGFSPALAYAQIAQSVPSAGVSSSQSAGAAAPGSTGSASLQAQAQLLLQQIAALQAKLAASGGATSATAAATATSVPAGCPQYARTLSYGATGNDVLAMQSFLARDQSVYPEGTVSGYYGGLTQAAVQRFQAKYNIVSSGSPSTTGYGSVGPRTASAMTTLCAAGAPVSQTSPVGGYVKVTPISGNAPLAVTVAATVNSTNSCDGALYALDYGDGSPLVQIPVAGGQCNAVTQNFSHVYGGGGLYQIKLAAGGHQTTATVTVYGQAGQNSNLSGASASNSGAPADSIRASITSGQAPLTVNFLGTVSSSAAIGCTGSCNDTISFGDGAIAQVPLPAAGSWQSYNAQHSYANPGTYTVQLLGVTGALDAPAVTINATAQPSAATTPGAATGGYQISTITSAPNNPLSVSAQITVPSGSQYQLDWGDGSPISTQTASNATFTASHAYTAGGSFVLVLKNGSGATQSSASFAISN